MGFNLFSLIKLIVFLGDPFLGGNSVDALARVLTFAILTTTEVAARAKIISVMNMLDYKEDMILILNFDKSKIILTLELANLEHCGQFQWLE